MLLAALREAIGDAHVLTDPDVRAGYESDWTGRFGGPSAAVVRPASTDEVVAVVGACAAHGAAIVPQGGRTGLVGGSVPRGGEVVLSLARLDAVGAVDPSLGHVLVGAGVTLARLQDTAATAGLDAGLDLGARDAATVGGLVACDAGGARALRHGTARARVAGLEAVLADGTVVQRLSGLTKDNAGADLAQLLVGTEGTLGIITRVLWRLVPREDARLAALVPLASITAARDLLAALRACASALDACELLDRAALHLALEHQRRRSPVRDAPVHVLVELAGRDGLLEQLADAFARAGIEDAAVAEDTTAREGLWRLREGVPEAIAAQGVPHKLDIGVPLAALEPFLAALPDAVAAVAPAARLVVFGHLGDGNLHVNVLDADGDDVDDAVLALVLAHGGTISAEHGVGVAKARWLARARPAEYATLVALKRALDPDDRLNPGAVLPPQREAGNLAALPVA